MKVLINCQLRRGASAVFSLELAKGLKKSGVDVYAVLSKDIENMQEWRDVLGDNNIYWAKTHRDKDKLDFVISTVQFILFGMYEINQKFKNVQFDVSLRTFYSHWAPLVDYSIKKDKIVTICHDPEMHSGTKKYMKKLYFYHVAQANDVFVLTKSFKSIVEKNYNIPIDKVHYVPHGRMQMYKERQDKKYNMNYSKEKTNFLFFGRIEKYKGLHVLAEACKILYTRRSDFTLTIAGNGDFGDYEESFKLLENVNIINRFIPDEEVGCLFDGNNIITVLPYIDATQSGVIPIAFEYETPVIASNTGGIMEQLDDGKIGVFFENGDAKDLADKMEYLMDNSHEVFYQKILMQKYRNTLNWDVIAQQFIKELYERVE